MTTDNIFCLLVGVLSGAVLIWPIAHLFGAQRMADETIADMRKVRAARRMPL